MCDTSAKFNVRLPEVTYEQIIFLLLDVLKKVAGESVRYVTYVREHMLLFRKPCSRYQKLMRQRKQRQAMPSVAAKFRKSLSVLGDRKVSVLSLYCVTDLKV